MPPNQTTHPITLETNSKSDDEQFFYDDDVLKNTARKPTAKTDSESHCEFEQKIIWFNVIGIGLFHFFGVVLYPFVAFKMKILTHLWSGYCSIFFTLLK